MILIVCRSQCAIGRIGVVFCHPILVFPAFSSLPACIGRALCGCNDVVAHIKVLRSSVFGKRIGIQCQKVVEIECHGGDKIVGIVVFVKFQSLSVNIFERDILFLCVKKSCGIGRSINGSPQHHIEITGKIFLCGVFFNIYGDTAFYLLIIFIRFVGPSSLIDKIVQELLNILKHSLVCALQLGGIDTHTHLKFL